MELIVGPGSTSSPAAFYMDCIDIDVDNGESGFFIIEIDAREREIIFLSSVFTRPKTCSH